MAPPSVTCYPSPGKAKAYALCEAFAAGSGGKVSEARLGVQPGAAFFYGVVDQTWRIFDAIRREKRTWYYCDNAYFDRGRQAFFRVTCNAFQLCNVLHPNYKRLELVGAKVQDWRTSGEHIVVCEQSDSFMRLCGFGLGWVDKVCAELKKHTDRPLRIRRWNRDKAKMAATLNNDLAGAHALVTHMSAAANEAVLAGIPVFVTGDCAARPVASGYTMEDLSRIEQPVLPDWRKEWAASLAAQQWTLEEIRNGKCWRDLHE